MTLVEKMIWWLGIDFLLALVPLIVHAVTGQRQGWHAAIGHGELILVACGICGLAIVTAATAETGRPRLRELRAAVLACALLFLLASGVAYATIVAEVSDGHTGNVLGASYVLASAALLIGFASLFVATKVEEAA